MKRTASGLLFLSAFFLSSCATNPFPKVQLVDISQRDPQMAVRQFGDKITKNFEALQSVTFYFFGREISGLGYLSVDHASRSFNLTCLTPMGVRLLTIQKDPNGLKTEFSFSTEIDKPEILTVMANDICRIYFDWTPAPAAELKRGRYKLAFTEKNSEGGRTRFVFGGVNTNLIEKQIQDKNGRVIIQYHGYHDSPEAFYPTGVFLNNNKYHYTLIIKTKEFHVD